MGRAYYEQGKYDSAIKSYQKAIAINPDYVTAHYNLARAYSLENEETLAIESLQKAMTLDKRIIAASEIDSAFDTIRENPEFQQLIIQQLINLVE